MTSKICRQYVLKLLILPIAFALLPSKVTNAQQSAADLQDVQQIVAIVNDELISLYDLKQRTLLLALSNGLQEITPEQQQLLQNQAMTSLIDDKLKMQEAEKFEALMSESELEDAFKNYARQFNLEPDALEQNLSETGIEKDSLLLQIKGSVAWQRVVGGLLQPLVNVTDDEVLNFIEKLERDKGKFEYQVSEIFLLISDNAQREETIANAEIIHEQLAAGTPFSGIAQQFSQSSTASVGGDMGWVMENELPDEVNNVIPTMEEGKISDPIITEDGVYILQLTSKRKILTLNDDDIAVELKFVFFSDDDYPNSSIEELNQRVYPTLNQANACEAIEENAEKLKASGTGVYGTYRIGDLPIEIKDEVLNLEQGQGTNLYAIEDGYRSFILCVKDIPEIKLPEFEAVLDNMTQSRLQLVARRHLRDLRRDAVVDYR